jgi:hypothetical protein
MVQVDQIIGAVGEVGQPAVRRGPTRRGIGRGQELGLDRRRRAERRLVQRHQVLRHRASPHDFGWQAVGWGDTALAAGVGLDHAGVHREAFAADQAFVHAALHHLLEQPTQQVAVAETAMAVLGEGGVVGHVAFQPQPAKTSDRPG